MKRRRRNATAVKFNVVASFIPEGITTCIVDRRCVNLSIVTLKESRFDDGFTRTALPKKVAALAILKDCTRVLSDL